jgi:uncharacterized membrane protein
MQALLLLLGLGLLFVLVVFPIWAISRINSLGKAKDALRHQLRQLETEVRELHPRLTELSRRPPAEVVSPATPPPEPQEPTRLATGPVAPLVAPPVPAKPVVATPPPSVVEATTVPPIIPTAFAKPAPEPPRSAPVFAELARSEIPEPPLRDFEPAARVNWEQFMGAKLFAWLGGLAGLLAVGFFVKYSFDHDLIPPEVRVAIGFLFALGLVVGGLKIDRTRYAVTAQTLIATGLVSLYTVTFACRSVYHFAFFGVMPTFLLMALITGTAFLLAVRLEAQVVAVLGILGGFLTPILVSSGQDNPLGLFGYIALLDVGLVAVALHRRWHYLVPLGAVGTILMQIAWTGERCTAVLAPTAMGVSLAFCGFFLATYFIAARCGRAAREITWSAIALPFVAFGLALFVQGYPDIAARPGLLFTFVLAADLCLLAVAWCDDELPKVHLVAGMAVFFLLAAWTGERLTSSLLPWALAFYLLYAALHTAFPLLLERRRPAAAPTWWSQLFPPLTLLVMLLPLFKLPELSLLFWPCVLLVDLLAIGLALATASLAAVGAVLALTLIATGVWVFQIPVTTGATFSVLLVIGGFALLFFAAGLFLVRRLGDRLATVPGLGDARAQIPALSALLPFVLLIMMTARLSLENPSPVFGLALLLVGLVLGLTAILLRPSDRVGTSGVSQTTGIEWLPACALAGVAGLEYSWRARHFAVDHAMVPLGWHLAFYAIFATYPFLFRRRFAGLTGPWAVAALGGVVQFPLVYWLVTTARPNDFPGVLPTLFAVPPLVSLVALLRGATADERARLNQLALFGGVTLLFITLIFPIQFERQWLTLGWALEGAALLWLFHRVPHPGLRAVGAGLLVTAFVRLALNPAVFAYHARSSTAVFNWYLYSYGLVIACLFVGAGLVRPPRDRLFGAVAGPALFNTLGTVLAFFLLNIEIADFFSEPGQRVLTFKFSGNFGRDMTYTIAWALFALGLLLMSIWKQARAGRRAALALLSVALIKLFFHDLARLGALHRIGALFAVAVIATLASFAYQRFLPTNEKNGSPQ